MLCTIIFGVVMKANVATGMVNVNMILVIWQTFSGFFIPKDDASQVLSYFQIILMSLLHRAPFGIVTSTAFNGVPPVEIHPEETSSPVGVVESITVLLGASGPWSFRSLWRCFYAFQLPNLLQIIHVALATTERDRHGTYMGLSLGALGTVDWSHQPNFRDDYS